MHVAGGLYHELCCLPEWNAIYGSGGRAALAISGIANDVVLHTYCQDLSNTGLDLLKMHGVKVQAMPRQTNIVFSYFHPLSTPNIQPPPCNISIHTPLHVTGEAVLRFGFLEGEAIVHAQRGVYDPQTFNKPPLFSSNGSSAEELAIVLNEQEIKVLAGVNDIGKAALVLMDRDGAKVVVAKGGIKGATVFEKGNPSVHVPAFRSSRVFKIGTGDVFSAIFSLSWAEQKKSPVESANIASRAVASYCETGVLPLSISAGNGLESIVYRGDGVVLILGNIETLGQRYVMEEARFVLLELGLDVVCPELGYTSNKKITSSLILVDGFGKDPSYYIKYARSHCDSIIILDETSTRSGGLREPGVLTSSDFTSAIYFSAWAACEAIINR